MPDGTAPTSAEPRLAELYRRFAPYVRAVAARVLGQRSDLEDIVQDVFVAAVQGLKHADDVAQTKGWLARVTVRLALRQARGRQAWRHTDLIDVSHSEALRDTAANPEQRHWVAEVYRALADVPDGSRRAWLLRYVEGDSLEETAAACDCSLATVKRRVATAHQIVMGRFTED